MVHGAPFFVLVETYKDYLALLADGIRANSMSTIKRYLLPFFGKHDVSEINNDLITEYKLHRQKQKISYGAFKGELFKLKAFINLQRIRAESYHRYAWLDLIMMLCPLIRTGA